MQKIIDKLEKEHKLAKEEWISLLKCADREETVSEIRKEAVRLRRQYYGDKVYTRGLIEFTNYCRNDCYYCGIQRSNQNAVRYRMTAEEILECCGQGYALGFRTFVLQGGEDSYYTDERTESIIKSIKEKFPECALTLSIGERSYESYLRYRKAGADRYLLRHETASGEHYQKLHPKEMILANRKQCLYWLKELGYQVGAGFMVGSPFQRAADIAEDMVFLQELQPQMVGIGPFIPHSDTRFSEYPSGSLELTLYLLSLVRIMLPKVLLPATTALGTVHPEGREMGLKAGANVVMPNLSPLQNRKKYELYDKKVCTGEEAAEGLDSLARRVEAAGYRLVSERGDPAV